MIKMGILGAGNIASTMAATIRELDSVECYAVGARDFDRAEAFAKKYGFTKAFGSYEELVKDPEVELIYIATVHSWHFQHIKLCLEHGKHVLCEKAFTLNERQASEVFAMAKERGLLLTEAIWTRYMPMRKRLDDVLASKVIGEPYMLTANLGYVASQKKRIVSPQLGGGALLDLGVYPLNFASMVFGDDVAQITGTAVKNQEGVDMQNSMTLTYKDGKMAVLNSSVMGVGDRRGVIYGDKGLIEVVNINNCEEIRVYDLKRSLVAAYDRPEQISGYEYEVEACVYAIQRGETECGQMPHEKSLLMMRWMDELRRQWGVKFPME